ncbi:TetR family transcriptional regulator [Tamaricihabitans halophyticus]|uniref:TetR family transcriptional regulator n=1 Tax=Tamaricihabitans halophyticus TaxID=1262583 RepID=A0A4R2R304_9PSEU|nr:TetR/AcrR family transcriptional regulator [Tamaricihabitans halophyticus]TCP57170.1 TetR family transcriptional regulator [Tamaricihabitans halophyticus]
MSSEPVPPPPWRRSANKSARPHLSVATIVAAALRVMDAEGLDAVSMRRVAQDLGTGAASLYAHVRNKQELHELILEEVFRGLEVPTPDPRRWQEQLKELIGQTTRIMLARPGTAQISLQTMIPMRPGTLAAMDATLGILRCAGIPDQIADYAADALALYGTAYAYEASLWPSSEAGQAEARRRITEIEEYLSTLPADRFPHLLAMMRRPFHEENGSERFEFALDIFIAGLAKYADPGLTE